MEYTIVEYNPNLPFKRGRVKLKNQKSRMEVMFDKIQLIENYLLKLKLISDVNGNQSREDNHRNNHSNLYNYLVWVISVLKDSNTLNDNSNKINIITSKFIKDWNETTCQHFLNSDIILKKECELNILGFNGSFIESEIMHYFKKTDPFMFWSNTCYLTSIFKNKGNNNLKLAFLLIFLRFGSKKNQQGSQWVYQRLKKEVSSLYLMQTFENLLTLVLLAFYELSYNHIFKFKARLSAAINYAQTLELYKLSSSEVEFNVKNNTQLSLYKKIWHNLLLVSFTLGTCLDEKAVCYSFDDIQFKALIQENNVTPFKVYFPVSKFESLIVIQQAQANPKRIYTTYKQLFHLVDITRAKIKNIPLNYLRFMLDTTEEKQIPYLSEYALNRIKQFHPTLNLNLIHSKIEKIAFWLNKYHLTENWLTFGPTMALSLYLCMITPPISFNIVLIPILNFLEMGPIANICYDQILIHSSF
ncbi:hypothetical protein K502DRAFT_329505 [Neoconidiobolus thromboides FSU 785]|nr:hypothetical protein K502DRAFT_329505 [Neoconidiobolus thromboides FSU 785]